MWCDIQVFYFENCPDSLKMFLRLTSCLARPAPCTVMRLPPKIDSGVCSPRRDAAGMLLKRAARGITSFVQNGHDQLRQPCCSTHLYFYALSLLLTLLGVVKKFWLILQLQRRLPARLPQAWAGLYFSCHFFLWHPSRMPIKQVWHLILLRFDELVGRPSEVTLSVLWWETKSICIQ